MQHLSIYVCSERKCQVFQVAVVAHINRCAGMHQIGDQEIGIEVLGGLQVSEVRIRKHRVVLADEAEGKFVGELVIPLAADNVVVHGAERAIQTVQPKQDVGVVDLQGAGLAGP